MILKKYNPAAVAEKTAYFSLEESLGGLVLCHVDENGKLLKRILKIAPDGVFLFECASDAGIQTSSVDGSVVIAERRL